MQKERREKKCSKCNCRFDNSNNGPRCYTEHHIWPERWFNGNGPKQVYCRQCHDVLEAIIKSAEGGKKKKKTKLAKKTYEMLNHNFLMSKYWDKGEP